MGWFVLISVTIVVMLVRKKLILEQIKQEIINLYIFKPDETVYGKKLYKYYKAYAHRLVVAETHFSDGVIGLYFEQILKESGDAVTVSVLQHYSGRAVISVCNTKAKEEEILKQTGLDAVFGNNNDKVTPNDYSEPEEEEQSFDIFDDYNEINELDSEQVVEYDFEKLKQLNGRFYHNAEPVSGLALSYYDNGTKKLEFYFRNGVMDGLSKTYHSNGTLKEEIPYQDGKINGVFKLYDENSSIKAEASYKEGFLDGESKEYYDNGQVRIVSSFVRGKINNLMKEYYDSGTLKGEFLYENNIRNGISKQYYENGRVKILIPFQYGKALGTAKEYYSDGQIKRESPFVDGLLHGIENWYNKKRNIILIIEYNAGLAVGGEKYEQGAFRSLTKAELNKWDSEESFHF